MSFARQWVVSVIDTLGIERKSFMEKAMPSHAAVCIRLGVESHMVALEVAIRAQAKSTHHFTVAEHS